MKPYRTAAVLALLLPLNVAAHGGNTNLVHACVKNSNLAVRIVAPNASCASGETAKHWHITGPRGPTGLTGPQGPAGADGTDGVHGAPGEVGPRGSAGPVGSAGPQGPQGVAGPTGPEGPIGEVGATGPQGQQGLEGLPATSITPIIWSGSCSEYTQAGIGIPATYCTDLEEFNTADGYFSVDHGGHVTIETPGFYRIHFRATVQFQGIWYTQAFKNGVAFHTSFNSNIDIAAWPDPYGEGIADVMQPLNAGDVITVGITSSHATPGQGHRVVCCGQDTNYGYHRLQVQYIGPLP